MNDNNFWLSVWAIAVAGIVAIIVSVALYANSKNRLILQADTCEKAALIDGVYSTAEIALCKIK